MGSARAFLIALACVAGCTVDRTGIVSAECEADSDCGAGSACVEGRCVEPDMDAGRDGGADAGDRDGGRDSGRDSGADAGMDAGRAFSPRDIAGLVLWLRADSLASGPVVTWNNEGTAVSDANPTGVTPIMNPTGAPHVEFNTLGHFTLESLAFGGNGVTMFFVLRMDGTAEDPARVFWGSEPSHLLIDRFQGNLRVFLGLMERTVPIGLGEWHLWTIHDNDTVTDIYRDGTSMAQNPRTLGRLVPSYGVGGNHDGSTTEEMAGGIAEILLYDAALSDADRAMVQAYLEERWAALLPP